MISKGIHSHLITRTTLQTRNLMNKIEEFWKCDDFSAEIRSLTDMDQAYS
jgi:HJR/Mrr/RecB family endonuclease